MKLFVTQLALHITYGGTDMTTEEKIVSYKGFDADMKCRGFQYAPGEEFKHDGDVETCVGGFHACEYPLDVLRYYPPSTSRFFVVEQSGTLSRHGDDSKVASSKIKIGVELSLPGLIKAAVEYTFSRAKPIDPNSPAHSIAENGLATASGDSGAATASGRHSVAMASGFDGRARGIAGAALFLVYRNSDSDEYGRIVHARALIVGREGIKPDTFYALNSSGEPIEV